MNVDEISEFIRKMYPQNEVLPLHKPAFFGNEKKYLLECVDSTFVSSVGAFVDRFEEDIANYVGANHAVAAVNGTAALHIALLLAGVGPDDEVITQPLTFVATCNAIHYSGAHPIFVDVDRDTMSLSPEKLEEFLRANTEQVSEGCRNKFTNRIIKAIVPMHTFGLPGRIEALAAIAQKFHIALVEDAAESLGSFYKGKHTGLFGNLGVLSFNGNKIITTGGGGMIITNDQALARKAKHLTTTAKTPHAWEYVHDEVGYNYRMPNINAALGCAQLENLVETLKIKRQLANDYMQFFSNRSETFVNELPGTTSNYWLNAIVLKDLKERNSFLEQTNLKGIFTRPIWRAMDKLAMYKNAQKSNLENSSWLEDRVVNLPSGLPS